MTDKMAAVIYEKRGGATLKKVMIAIGKLTGGGAERVATVWANQLNVSGCKVSLLSLFRSDDEYDIGDGIVVYRVADKRNEFSRMSFFDKFKAFRKIIRTEKPEYIISFLPYVQTWVMMTSLGLGVKRIETVRNNLEREFFPNAIQRILWKSCYSTCSGIILQSSEQAPYLTKRQQRKCVVIPNPVDDVYLHSCKETLSIQPQSFVAVGRIHEQKNYPMMIKGFASVCSEHPELTLSIYGTGKPEYVEYIQGLIADEGMGDHIFLMGRVNHIEQEYLKHDVFLMTSDYEGMPNALAEAMASKLICISTDCKTGPRDLIDNGVNGFLVPAADEAGLQRAIKHVLSLSSKELEFVASRAREKILTYCSKENSTQQVLDMLQ